MSTTDLAIHRNGTDLDVMALGRVLAQSGYFKDAKQAAEATVKVLAGREMGIGPVAAMMGIYFFEGKVTISAGLMAAAVRSSAKYDYRLGKHDETVCEIEFFQGAESLGIETFTMKDAQTAGLAGKVVWKSYPRNMLFARCLSNGVRFKCPNVFKVGSVYTPEEMGADVDRDGNAINVKPSAAVVSVERVETAAAEADAQPETIRQRLRRLLIEAPSKLTEEQRDAMKAEAVEIQLPADPRKTMTDEQVLGWADLIDKWIASAEAF